MSDRSNILKVFNPPSNDQQEKVADCLPCDIFNSIFLVGLGSYLASGKAIKRDPKLSLKEFNAKHPNWWRVGLRGFGGVLLFYGAFRGSETFFVWKSQQVEKRIME
ncbi:hypothetical protein KAFR_0B00930 [Kazachstania africana CBS 2517]|uniref:DUF4536 domain-containing protein n=1 Tax=Kazachstania africana (strain ATCC 22294 / BCRC 22015 / CBS 2517 / CECT 1963 / NBRC 1671 / NRRL Y-8276) TaxID=1071382 RepID=H2APU1_KAZAF|nr:hypothetical protein KAFR_0B00930 [Kazachstania africana CBS 2517]CCF56391.1 hypothetical protein KAFR_0B00930 [Kazachstania africana CBS 2517]